MCELDGATLAASEVWYSPTTLTMDEDDREVDEGDDDGDGDGDGDELQSNEWERSLAGLGSEGPAGAWRCVGRRGGEGHRVNRLNDDVAGGVAGGGGWRFTDRWYDRPNGSEDEMWNARVACVVDYCDHIMHIGLLFRDSPSLYTMEKKHDPKRNVLL